MPNVSYAQNREDVLLSRVLPGPVGFYIDVGAADPVELSVTKWFYDRGWSGINVEPQGHYFEALRDARPRDTNLRVLLSDAAREVTLYEVPGKPMLTTPDEATAEYLRGAGNALERRVVRSTTLAEVCERYVRGPIDFLKVDVEGHELAVLRGADFRRWRPVVLVVEATEAERPIPNHHAWEPVVLAADYVYAAFDGLNRYYVRSEDAHLAERLAVPVNIFDDYFVPHDRYKEQCAWHAERERERSDRERERAAWEAERAAWEANREAERQAERAAFEAELAARADRVRWLEGQIGLYRAA